MIKYKYKKYIKNMGREEQIIGEREKKLLELKKLGINAYPNKFEKKNNSSELQINLLKKLKEAQRTK